MLKQQSDIEQAVAKIYSAMLDDIALTQRRRWAQDVLVRGTGVMTVDYTPCECPACRRARSQGNENPRDRRTSLDAFVIAVIILAGVAVALVLKAAL